MEFTTIVILLAVVLLCPVSMFWMMRGHRRKMDGEGSTSPADSLPSEDPRFSGDPGHRR